MNLIIGIGNTLRNDDGIGAYIIKQIDKWNTCEVVTRTAQQIHLEMLDEFLLFEKIIIVDASEISIDYNLKKLSTSNTPTIASSHHVSLELIIQLTKIIYHQDINLFLCSLRGYNFEIGETLSTEILACVPKALLLISNEIGRSSEKKDPTD
jgi:hydrogenase maturation protease